MAETVELPVIGNVPKTYVYVGGAVIAGIVGYAWFTNSQADEEYVPDDGYPYDEGDIGYGDDSYVNPAPGGSTVDSEPVDPDSLPPTTNGEWTRRAIDQLEAVGYDAKEVARVLGKYLGRRQVTKAEASIIRAAIGVMGPPPQGEYFILQTGGSKPEPEKPKPDKVPRHRTWSKRKTESISNMVGRYNKRYKTNYTAEKIMGFNRRHRKDSAMSQTNSYWFPINPKDIND